VAVPGRGGGPRDGPQPGHAEGHVREVADRVARVGDGVGAAQRRGGEDERRDDK